MHIDRSTESGWDRDESRFTRPNGPLHLLRPAYGGASLPNIAATLVREFRADAARGPPLAPALERSLDPFAQRRPEGTVVVALVDGLGWLAYRRWLTEADAAGPSGAWARAARPITTVFPTTTAPALASLSTGEPTGRHGVVGFRQFLPAFGVVVDLLRMSPTGAPELDQLVGPAWTRSMVAGAPTIFERGVRGAVLSRDRFEGSGTTSVLYGDAEFVGYSTASHLAEQLVGLLTRSRPPDVIYTYWDELDTAQHLCGPSPRLVSFEMSRIVHLLGHVARRLPSKSRQRTTLLLTGDHGQVSSDVRQRVRVDRLPDLVREMRHPLAGDRRSGYFAARPGRRRALERALRANLPKGTPVLPMTEAVRLGLYGPPPYHPELSDRLGDYLALIKAPGGLVQVPAGRLAPARYSLGAHGGLTPEELLVPLIAGTFAELSDESMPEPVVSRRKR